MTEYKGPFASDIVVALGEARTPYEAQSLQHLLKVMGNASRCDKNFNKKLSKLMQRMGSKMVD